MTVKTRLVHLVSLGCARNRVDAEVILGSMLERRWALTEEPLEADAIVVNTCGFIGPAKEESIDHILESCALKVQKPDLKVVVSGCLSQRYRTQLAKGIPEVDLWIGVDEFPRLVDLIDEKELETNIYTGRTHYIYDGRLPKFNTLSKTSAYVKVAEGCQHNCAFCIIPAIRGKLRSRPIENVVEEVEKLAAEGVVEVNLIAQDLAAYGRDQGVDGLLDLLRALVKIDDLQWIRLLYVYPENISDEFLDFFANEEKIVKYLDIPVQHGSNSVLSRMNREVTREEILSTVRKLRLKVPNASIRTSVMVGFPAETEEEFADLLTLVEEASFDHLGCFSYSKEEGTVAGRMEGQIDEETKAIRLAKVMQLQKIISSTRLQQYIGQTLPVLMGGISEESEYLYEGRMSTQAPEVDGKIYINDGPVVPGTIQLVKITEAFDYDLVGHVVDEYEPEPMRNLTSQEVQLHI